MSCPNSCDKFCIPCVQKLAKAELHRLMCSAIHAKDSQLARFYLANGVDVRMKDSVILVNAIEKNFPLDFIAECIRMGADVNARNGRALKIACQYSDRAQAVKLPGFRTTSGRTGAKKTNEWIQYRNDILSLLLDSGAIVDDVCFNQVLNTEFPGSAIIPNRTATRLFEMHGFEPRGVHLFDKFLQCAGENTFFGTKTLTAINRKGESFMMNYLYEKYRERYEMQQQMRENIIKWGVEMTDITESGVWKNVVSYL